NQTTEFEDQGFI
ncbi:hypothetical protein D041_4094B, partial [Vibrio parahaemolyticus EKP-008]